MMVSMLALWTRSIMQRATSIKLLAGGPIIYNFSTNFLAIFYETLHKLIAKIKIYVYTPGLMLLVAEIHEAAVAPARRAELGIWIPPGSTCLGPVGIGVDKKINVYIFALGLVLLVTEIHEVAVAPPTRAELGIRAPPGLTYPGPVGVRVEKKDLKRTILTVLPGLTYSGPVGTGVDKKDLQKMALTNLKNSCLGLEVRICVPPGPT